MSTMSSADKVTLYYKQAGQGYPVIFLHGLTGDHTMFEREMEQLKDGFRVIALDMRGHGRSDKPKAYTLEDHIQDVLHMMNKLDIESAHLVGVSMGSYIAQGVAVEAPKRVAKLVLTAPKAHGKTSSTARLFAEHEAELSGLSHREKLNKASMYIYHDIGKVQDWSKQIEDRAVELNAEEEQAASDALKGFDFRDQLPFVEAESLVISGKYDGLNPPEYGREIADLIPSCRFVEYEHSGHGINVEEHERFVEEVREFLQ
ncbi:3-oxoadipate enol-lactonase [Marinococcus luteus]|uniref:3-oxoadipate enol-lactonase n=1 Tax=Marinococcus luteus TaxID=1122204 RepID=A0A1H2UMG2_9BACI|nr:alpha/beta fold hydrolase [Marinococcus luteus]SDW57356.1 3-oxoadipate enol-lactonase [Marinococcus luteus]